MKIAVIGDPIFVKAFELVGAEGFQAETEKEVKEKLMKLLEKKEHGLIILPERFVKATKEIRQRLLRTGAVYPLFAFMPDYTGIKDKRIEELQRLISLAVGIQLKL